MSLSAHSRACGRPASACPMRPPPPRPPRRFALPDDVVFVQEIPHNATGKVSKLTLREMFKDHKPARARL